MINNAVIWGVRVSEKEEWHVAKIEHGVLTPYSCMCVPRESHHAKSDVHALCWRRGAHALPGIQQDVE